MSPVCQTKAPSDAHVENYGRKKVPGEVMNMKVEETLSELRLTNQRLTKIRDCIFETFQSRLKNMPQKETKITMLPTYVTHLPDGTEKGTFLALDLGGANFRVVKVHLPGNSSDTAQVLSQVYIFPQQLLVGTAQEFFDHIAKSVADFVDHHGIKNQKLPLGITFSFPCAQKGLRQSFLLRWTKGFDVSGVVGKDIVKLLEEALQRQRDCGVKCSVDVVAVVNDTVGTLMSCAYGDQNCCIGMIVGTGTNACYMESAKDIEFLDDCDHHISGENDQMCVSTEWGSLGEDGSLDGVRTSFDQRVDGASTNSGCMIYEKMISGLYLGDIVREVLLLLIKEGTLFGGELTEEMKAPHSFPSSFLTQFELEGTPELTVCGQILNNLGYPSTTANDRHTIKEVCRMVSKRAAHLCAAGVSALVERIRLARRLSIGETLKVTVAVDGTLYKKHPTFRHILRTEVHELSPCAEVTFRISHDGSGKGTALVSAVKCKILRAQEVSS